MDHFIIKELYSSKAASFNGIHVAEEALKSYTTTVTKMLHILFHKIWKEDVVLQEKKEGLIIEKETLVSDIRKCLRHMLKILWPDRTAHGKNQPVPCRK